MQNDAVVVTRGDVQYVATEYGVVNLFGKSLQERVIAMISIAHPDFRDELFGAAKEAGLVGPERTLGEAAKAVYPVLLEDKIVVAGETITIRPAKPVDERRIQGALLPTGQGRYLPALLSRKDQLRAVGVETKSQIDYIKDMTLIGVVGESGFDKVVAVAEYLLLLESNMAEVALR